MNPSLIQPLRVFRLQILFAILVLVFSALACNLLQEEIPWTPETPKQYTAVTEPVEVYVLMDQAGNMVDFGGAYSYGVTARLQYVLRLWDVGILGGETHKTATIHKAYTPLRITAIQQDLESTLSDEAKAEVYARTSFPTTEIQWTELTFSGGPEGTFLGANPDTGKDIYGYMDWREKEWEMHICLYYDVMERGCLQDYRVQGEEPFYNWP